MKRRLPFVPQDRDPALDPVAKAATLDEPWPYSWAVPASWRRTSFGDARGLCARGRRSDRRGEKMESSVDPRSVSVRCQVGRQSWREEAVVVVEEGAGVVVAAAARRRA